MEGGKVLLDLCVSVLPLGRTDTVGDTVGDLGWAEGSAFVTQRPGEPKGQL